MKTYIATAQRLIAAGYPRDKAILVTYRAFGLTAEQAAVLGKAIK